ncbi:MAG TPA: HD domain-containing protein [Candidatus Saccharimonadales bacterium]|nr:HD domain-containing protein [Candidatus Saccharimonadales bacterium]
MSAELEELLDFVRFTHEIRNVKRAILLESNDRQENDEEHMYQLALLAWFIIENDGLKLDKFKVVGMCLVQDVTEVYSGDTNAHASAADREAHSKREKMAAKKLKQQWPTFTSLHKLLAEYQARQTPEAKFVYALDKLIPIINIYLYEGRSWIQQGIDFKEMQRVKVGKVDISPEIGEYYQAFLKILKDKPELFGVTGIIKG